MSAIGGIIRLDGMVPDRTALERMKDVLTPYGSDTQHLWKQGPAGLFRTLRRITVEDAFDRQPLVSKDSALVLVADGRIDNRDELAEQLGITPQEARLMADSAFILRAYESWGEACLNRLLGDYAFALWETRAQRLTLVRDPLGCRSLYWYRHGGFFAFATLSKGLFALPEVPRALCDEQLAAYLACLPMVGPESFYRDVYRVEPGHFVCMQEGKVRTHRYHRFNPNRRITLPSDNDYVEAFREHLEQAVRSRLRCVDNIGSHLSSGFDSSTVTAIAARLLAGQGKRLTAYTAAPREGFAGRIPRGSHGDESAAAAALVASFPSIDHVIIRSDGSTPVDDLETNVSIMDRAPINPWNSTWLNAIDRDAANRGIRVMLTGQMGNLTISHYGENLLHSLLRQGRLRSWYREAVASRTQRNCSWRRLLRRSVSPFVPLPIWRLVEGQKSLYSRLKDYTAINADLFEHTQLYRRACHAGWDLSHRPSADSRRARITALNSVDLGDLFAASVGLAGVEMRDPTSDRRLVEFCLAIPEEQYFHNGQNRWLLRRLMGSVLPVEIMDATTRGWQAADWYEGFSNALPGIRQLLNQLKCSSEVPRFLDLERMELALEHWPTVGDWDQSQFIKTYLFMLLRGISVGAFILYVENGNR